jgi:hypothetical protein
LGKGVDQRGLSHASLTADQDHAPAPSGRLAQVFLKLRQGLFALD